MDSRRSIIWLATMGVTVVSCTPPPSVQAVDRWLTAYEAGDVEAMLRHSVAEDQPLIQAAMNQSSLTSSVASILPPKPVAHELVEIERKDSSSRHIVLCKVTTKNPLAFTSKQVGQDLDIPPTRTRLRRFLSVRDPSGRWGVKLDLPQVMKRIRFVDEFSAHLDAGGFDQAEAMLSELPESPDEPNTQPDNDRLSDSLTELLAKVRKRSARTSTVVQTSSPAAPPSPSPSP